jgi:hypothetical protein
MGRTGAAASLPLRHRRERMPDFLKKVVKDKSGELRADEQYLGAAYAQPAGAFGRSVGFAAGGLLGGAVAARSQKKREEELDGAHESGIAASFPNGNVVMAVTGQRLLVFGHGALKGKPTDLRAEYPLSDVHRMALEKRRGHSSLKVTFSDNSVRDFDVVTMAKPDRLVAAFEEAKGRS